MKLRIQKRRAFVLLAVLVVIVLLSLAAYRYTDWMTAEGRATQSSIKAMQARSFAVSGMHYAAAQLVSAEGSLGGNPYDNAGVFQGIEVPIPNAPASRTGRFAVLSVLPDGNQTPYRFGVVDEASKINLNALLAYDNNLGDIGKQMLMALPNMTSDVADAILDWLDPDDTPRENGAENQTYSTQSPPYRCKNGPLDSLDELLLVRGVTPQLLYGNDRNRNGVLDADEDSANGVDAGWSTYLTVYSREVNLDNSGQPRINLKNRDLAAMKQSLGPLGEELTNYIMAYRIYGGSKYDPKRDAAGKGKDLDEAMAKLKKDMDSTSTRPRGRLNSVWDLVNSKVTISIGSGRMTKSVILPSPLLEDDPKLAEFLPQLLDTCTTTRMMDLSPRINVATASQPVLEGLKEATGLTDEMISMIISQQPGSSNLGDPTYKTPAWLYTQAKVKVDVMKKLDKFITSRTQVYRFQSVGWFDNGGPVSRLEAVVDVNQGRPRIAYFRDLSELGRGFDFIPATQR
jgi:hypothetical protein